MCTIDLHVHTTFSDGESTPEEIVIKAIEKNMKTIGFSDHSYTPFDESYCIKKNQIDEYIKCISQLKDKYKSKIQILCGIEQDYYSEINTNDFDYVIGSVHYIRIHDEYIPVDETDDILKNAADKYYEGDLFKLINTYYQTVADVINKTNADIIGHIDLISKFNNGDHVFFDEQDDRYIKAYTYACDEVLKSDKKFEINTGCLSRGYKSTPYPSESILKYLKSKNAKFILSSDSHNKNTLCYKFDKYKNWL